MNLRHRVRTPASPAQVWAVLGDPRRWPEYDLFLHRVLGATGPAVTGQHLMGVGRALGVRIPVDVVEAVPERRLVLRIAAAPGLLEEVTHEIRPLPRGGCDLTVRVVVAGLFARGAALPMWLGRGVTTRVLARRVRQLAAAAGRAPVSTA